MSFLPPLSNTMSVGISGRDIYTRLAFFCHLVPVWSRESLGNKEEFGMKFSVSMFSVFSGCENVGFS